jgi:hypothetical protein
MTTLSAAFTSQFSAFENLSESFRALRAKTAWTTAALILTALPYLLFV